MKKIIFALIVLLAIGGGYYLFFIKDTATVSQQDDGTLLGGAQPLSDPEPVVEIPVGDPAPVQSKTTIIGYSVNGYPITAYHYGTGDTELLFIGGMHGGYEWNTILLSYQLMDYLDANPDVIPENIKVTVVPVLNPDGLKEVVGTTERFSQSDVPTDAAATVPGRFNGDNVDINRNFDCDWQSTGIWQDKTVDAGTAILSEPEAKAVADYIVNTDPVAVVAYFSSAGGVYASNCHNGVLSGTETILNTYANASGYPAFDEFDFYVTTGDITNWLAKQGTPAISVLLTNHTDTEWSKNKAGVDALINLYAQQ